MSKDQLALAVRKNFNALAIHESEVIVDFIYSVKHQGESQLLESGHEDHWTCRLIRLFFGCR